jgi:hypothetical protein
MEVITLSIVALIINICTYELTIPNCNETVNKCLDKKVWEYREKLSEPDDEMMQILLNECVEELKK